MALVMMTARKVAIITGGGSGIGRAASRRLAADGFAVLVADLSVEDGRAVAEDITGSGGDALFVRTDVARPSDADAMVAAALARWGRIDVLVANAGVQIGGDLLTTSDADWDRILDVNLKGVGYCCRAVLPALQAEGGTIVITSSNNAFVGSPHMAVYDASKAGVLALMRSLACRHGAEGIRVNAICPGATITDYHIRRAAARGQTVDDIRAQTKGYGLLGRAAEPAEIAAVISFLAGPESSFITGQAIVVDGGASVTAGG